MLYSAILLISIIYIISLIKRDYIYDLSISRKFNYFDIHDIDKFIKNIPECPNSINIDTYLIEEELKYQILGVNTQQELLDFYSQQ